MTSSKTVHLETYQKSMLFHQYYCMIIGNKVKLMPWENMSSDNLTGVGLIILVVSSVNFYNGKMQMVFCQPQHWYFTDTYTSVHSH